MRVGDFARNIGLESPEHSLKTAIGNACLVVRDNGFEHFSPPTLVARSQTTQSKFNMHEFSVHQNIVPSFRTQFELVLLVL